LKDLMRSAGSVRRVEVQNSGKPYATVEFDDAQSAENAISMFNDYTLDRNVLHVREDRGSAPISTGDEVRIFFSNLPFRAEWQEVKDMCAPFGNVVRADVDRLPDGRSAGTGTAVLASQDEAWACIQGLNGEVVEGRQLSVYASNSAAPASGFRTERNAYASNSGAPASGFRAERNAFKTESAPASSNQACRIIFSNLPFRAEWQELKDMCAPFGSVVRADVDKLPDGRSKGSGTVVFASQDEAWECIRSLDGQVVEGRQLGVRAAAGDVNGAPIPGFKVFVGNLPFSTNWQTLKDMGRPFGEVLFADLALEPSGRPRGFGVLTFAESNAARACIANLHGTIFEGRDLTVHEDKLS
jgi:RNA recognition motif-containing protein